MSGNQINKIDEMSFIRKNKAMLVLILIFFVTVPLLLTPWIYTDGAADYSWVRSFILDGNLDCSNEFKHYGEEFQRRYGWEGVTTDLQLVKTATGVQANKYPVGSALLWSPFFLIGHLITVFFTNYPADGYSKFYVLLVSLGSCIYAFLGIFFSYLIAKNFFPPRTVLWATIGIWFATSIPVYMYLNPSMPHNTAMFAVSLFLLYWLKTLRMRSAKQWLILGLLGGLMTMVRLENVIFTLCPFVESLHTLVRLIKTKNKQPIKSLAFNNLLFIIILVVAFFPQMVVWKIVFGRFFVQPYELNVSLVMAAKNSTMIPSDEIGQISTRSAVLSFLRFFTHPHLSETLWGSSYGIFTWTPITLFSLVGLFWLIKKNKVIGIIITLALLAIVYVTSCSLKGGASFGDRYLIICTPIYIIGVSALISRFKNNLTDKIVLVLLSLFMIWNGLFIVQYATGLVPRMGPISWRQMIKNQFTKAPQKLIIMAKPFLLGRDAVYNVKTQKQESKSKLENH